MFDRSVGIGLEKKKKKNYRAGPEIQRYDLWFSGEIHG